MLSVELIEELRGILKSEYAADLNFEQAREVGTALVKFFEILSRVEARTKTNKEVKNEQV